MNMTPVHYYIFNITNQQETKTDKQTEKNSTQSYLTEKKGEKDNFNKGQS